MIDAIGKTMSRSRAATHKEFACISLGKYSQIQGELLWEQGNIACIRHCSEVRVGTRIRTAQRSFVK
ncbi:hypothetical protein EDD53_0030 [Pacificibacter maritimus]|uniref:Uncharacterized protein n=1 Tax=Pacificibacter maritimus TaxID=762213 RepID=A0A3N4VAT2_9RHOB|nr:hypothetical protein EDD53_0030 [Pacificibacter maritimus]